MRNFRLTLSYDGSRYAGWQRQGNTENSLEEKLSSTLSRLLDQPVEVAGSGRTDAGVHARAQVASFRADTDMSCPELLRALREVLPEDIGALTLEEAPPRFHARLNAKEKVYVYRIWNSETPCVFERKYVWVLPEALDVAAMREAAAALCGEHDYSSFRSGKSKKSAVRTVSSIDVAWEGEELRLKFTGNGFLYHMVRILTGTLVEVGRGKLSAEDMPAILERRDRAAAGPTAPAQGLILWDESY